MGAWKLLWFCVIYYSAVLQAISVETQAGLSVSVVMETHVYENSQSDFFRFEVQSCENVDVILKDGGLYGMSVVLTLSQTSNESAVKICRRAPLVITEGCHQVARDFTTPDFCLAPAVFWVWKERFDEHAVGSGCAEGVGKLTDFQAISVTSGTGIDYVIMEVKSMTSAQWKFGESVCAPPTTTFRQTTTRPLENVHRSSTITATTPENDLLNDTLKCPTDNGGVGRSATEVTCSVTWPLMALVFFLTLMCSM